MIDRPTVDRILEAANIVDVISEYVSLRKAGTSYKGLCPFHDDRTPSFSVSPAKGVYKCFSCGEAGNVVNFIMKHDQMTYPEALKVLAKKYGIEVKERELTTEEKQLENERESMFLVNEWAAKYFQNILHNHVDGKAIGLQYFRNRGFRDDIIEKFQLGFCLPGKQEFANAALKAGYKAEFLVKTGLCFERENGELADRFNGRVIFPWLNVSGKVIAFGGRLLDSRTKGISQKYVNSPGSEIYQKDHALYGIYQAKKAIAKFDLVYMVEGYTDVVSMHQCGIENVVANSGTALSVYQIKLLRRFTSNIVLLYDGDEAGQHAALRGTDMLLSEGMNVKVLLLPDGKDPDELARNLTAEAFRKYIEENQTDFIVFKINVLLRGITDPVKRSEAINSIVQSIAVIKDPILRDTYLRECAHRTGMKENTLIAQMNRFIYNDREQQRKEQVREAEQTVSEEQVLRPATPMQQASKVETMLVQAIVRDGEKIIIRNVLNDETGEKINLNVAQYIAYDLGLDNLSFKNPLSVQILTEAIEHSGDENFKAEEYFTHHPDILISTLAVKLSVDRFQLSESMQMKEREIDLRDRIMHLILDYRMDYVEQHLKELQASLSAESDLNKVMEIMGEIKKMQDMRNVLARKLGNDIVV
ncbi:DNA primase [Prevotella nigrescens]|jgi:DNA primase|uniref:DNA primase n=1 Tax=Prevotella nigrescens TaxID=28133 RepID=UPI000B4D6BEB|nr:DNA primase [Prevotella nigrescens]MBF1445139.1 DNA primase [Prevotella nigrescens]MBW4727309.1 DNA primase [Prevotella nigrescens]OWP29829.1 DNA primase [Prevotella nigrescens]QUB53868.1 DNA primase [Prevotella nigrescens F0103]